MGTLHGQKGLGRRTLLVAVGCALMLGCPASQQRRGEDGGSLLWVQVQALGGQGLRPLKVGAPLSGGDRFGLLVEAPEPRYLQLALLAPDDPTPTLWPPEDQAPPQLLPGRPVNIPGSTQWFRAEQRSGQGALVLVLSPQPLAPSAVSALLRSEPLLPLSPGALSRAAAQSRRDPAEWTAWSLPAEASAVRLSLPQR